MFIVVFDCSFVLFSYQTLPFCGRSLREFPAKLAICMHSASFDRNRVALHRFALSLSLRQDSRFLSLFLSSLSFAFSRTRFLTLQVVPSFFSRRLARSSHWERSLETFAPSYFPSSPLSLSRLISVFFSLLITVIPLLSYQQ